MMRYRYVVVVYDRDGNIDRFTFANADLLKAKSFAYEESQWESCERAEIRTESGKLVTTYMGAFS